MRCGLSAPIVAMSSRQEDKPPSSDRPGGFQDPSRVFREQCSVDEIRTKGWLGIWFLMLKNEIMQKENRVRVTKYSTAQVRRAQITLRQLGEIMRPEESGEQMLSTHFVQMKSDSLWLRYYFVAANAWAGRAYCCLDSLF
jgi:hypothetical protein